MGLGLGARRVFFCPKIGGPFFGELLGVTGRVSPQRRFAPNLQQLFFEEERLTNHQPPAPGKGTNTGMSCRYLANGL